MNTSIEQAPRITSAELHNRNCFEYLKKLNFTRVITTELTGVSPRLEKLKEAIQNNIGRYNASFNYADLYKRFMEELEQNITGLKKINEASLLIDSLYNNNNNILINTFETIKSVVSSHRLIDEALEKKIKNQLKDSGPRVNVYAQTPAEAGSTKGRFSATISSNFKPQYDTSLPTVRTYAYKTEELSLPKELRFGTQGQRHQGQVRVNPLFEAYLDATTVHEQADKITHVYFNNLGRDTGGFEGNKERALSYALENLEQKHSNVAVITLPADKGLMKQDTYKETKPIHAYNEVFQDFLDIATENPRAKHKVKDFHISEHIRKKVFSPTDDELLAFINKDKTEESKIQTVDNRLRAHYQENYFKALQEDKLKGLLSESFKALGIQEGAELSSAQRQAVWFDFVKYRLTNHILNELKPATFNCSCKDAIDRGGVSSAYYNLLKSIESGNPMRREEWEQALHAAPAMVKGRGMNHNLNVLWNTIDAYIQKNDDKTPAWLIEWRDMNCPHKRVEELLERRVKELSNKILTKSVDTLADSPQKQRLQEATNILSSIGDERRESVSGKRLLLEAAVRTASLALAEEVTSEDLRKYETTTKELSVRFPRLKMLAGLLRSFFGMFSSEQRKLGWAVYKSGLHADIRQHSQENMQRFKKIIQDLREDAKDSSAEMQEIPKSPSPGIK